VDDDANKLHQVTLDDARVLVGFTGLAGTPSGSFVTSDWLPDAFAEAATPERRFAPFADRLRAVATRKFAEDAAIVQLTPAEKRLTIMIAGCQYLGDLTGPTVQAGWLKPLLVTNCRANTLAEARDVFEWKALETSLVGLAPRPAGHAQYFFLPTLESLPRLDEAEIAGLNRFIFALQRDVDPRELVGRAVRFVRMLSDKTTTGGRIGRRISIAALDRAGSSVFTYRSEGRVEKILSTPTHDFRTGRGVIVFGQPTITFQGPDGRDVLASIESMPRGERFYRVSRGAPCPCGNGKVYRFCHGYSKKASARLPVSP
jgi:hypothetical protein